MQLVMITESFRILLRFVSMIVLLYHFRKLWMLRFSNNKDSVRFTKCECSIQSK